jgi:hypothetical protein
MYDKFHEWMNRDRVVAPQPTTIVFSGINDAEVTSLPPLEEEPQQISGFTCFIDYEGTIRRIVCRRFDLMGDVGYVGAVCLSANGYRQFRTDRIQTVFDALTGEVIGDGRYFLFFAVDSKRDRVDNWGLKPTQRATLVAGLNVLAFMARCDGQWHPLESDPVEQFICSMWLRKEWSDGPQLSAIMAHAQRLAPDAETFFKGLAHYAQSSESTLILRRAVTSLIEADGVVADAEFQWALEFDAFFERSNERELRELSTMAHRAMVARTH